MANAIPTLSGELADAETCSCIGVVLYPDHDARYRAMQLCSRITQRFQNLIDLEFRWWRFQYLQDPILMGQAIQEVLPANIIILSYHSGMRLPDEVKAFYEVWVDQRKKGPGAIIGLGSAMENAADMDCRMVDYLQEIADRAQVDLITEARLEWQSELAQISCRAHHVTPTLEAILHYPSSLSDPVPLRL